MANIGTVDYVSVEDETYVVSSCTGCGRSYEEGETYVSIDISIDDTPQKGQWVCCCRQSNPMVYHNDDCPCTIGMECEQAGAFDTEE